MKIAVVALAVLTAGLASPKADLTVVKGDLRKLLVAQETWYSDHGAYSNNIAGLKFTPSDSVSVRIVEFSNNAYSASGTMKGADGMSCVYFVGHVAAVPKTAKGKPAEAEGGVICDE